MGVVCNDESRGNVLREYAMSNIMIIYPMPDFIKKPRFGFSYDLLTIATVLSREGHNIFLKDFSCEPYNFNCFAAEIIDKKIELVLIEFDSFALKRSENYTHGLMIVETIKSINEQIAVIAYGHHCCISHKDIPKAAHTVKQNNYNEIFKAINRTITSVKKISYISEFDSLPVICRGLLWQIEYYKKNSRSTLVQTAVGCENTCVFCQRKGWQKKYQAHSDNYVLNEFRLLRDQGYINIWIVDENFTFNLSRAKRILRLLIDNNVTDKMKISISSWSNIDDDFLFLASQANIKTISFGVESGNQNIINFYRKNIDLTRTKSIIRSANKLGIFTVGNFIIGAPMESYDTIDETFKFIRECEFDQVNIKTLDYMMGSELYESVESVAQGRSHIFACEENGLTGFSLQEIADIKINFLSEYYAEHKGRIKRKIEEFGTPYEM